MHEVTNRVGKENVKGRLGGTKTCHGKHNKRRNGKGFIPCAISIMDPALAGTGCGHLWSGLWSSLGGGRNKIQWLWLSKGDCPGRWVKNARGERGNPQCAVRSTFPTRGCYLAGCLARHKCLRVMEVEQQSSQNWSQGSPKNRYLPSGLCACCGLGGAGSLQQAMEADCWRADLSWAGEKTGRCVQNLAL